MAERRSEGFEPWAMDPWRMDPWTRTMTSAFRFWLSFWPVAPLFGVEWRFAGLGGAAEPGGAGEASERTVSLASPAPVAVTKFGREAEPALAAGDAGDTEEAGPDDLTRIKGIGPGLARQLNALGIHRFGQLAALTEQELAALDAKLTSIRGRCFRDDWLGQARALAG